MTRQAVESSAIRSIGYDRQTQTLEIEFRNGGIYQYTDVPYRQYRYMLREAPSIGQYYNRKIKIG